MKALTDKGVSIGRLLRKARARRSEGLLSAGTLMPRPGSMGWLLVHDMRLAWRDFRGTVRSLGTFTLAALILVLAAVMHAAAWPVAEGFASLGDEPASTILVAPAVLFILLLMIAQTLNGTTRLLYSRGDLDLLLCSPIAARSVLGVRCLGVAAGAMASAAIFVLPLADMGLLLGHRRCLALYPALLGGGFLAAAVGLVTTLALFRVIGPRATRLAAQILATVVGAAFLIGLQLKNLVPFFSLDAVVTALRDSRWGAGGLLLPVDAVLGRPVAGALWLFGSLGLFATAAHLCGPGFAAYAKAATTAPSIPWTGRRRPKRRGAARFPGGLMRNLHLKEWRLIGRDPWVVSQILLQILYMAPIAVVLWSGIGSAPLGLASTIVVVTFQLASSLTWLSLSGEDAPELLATAPVRPETLRRGKIEAVAVLTLCVAGAPLVWLAVLAPVTAGITAACCALALLVAVFLQLWQGTPGKRSAFAARHRQSKLLAMIEMAMSMLWGIATALGVLPSLWALVPLGLIGAILLCCRPRRLRISSKP